MLTLETDNLNMLKWFIDASYAVHKDIKGHTDNGLAMGKDTVFSKSTKQKLNTKSSTETEIVGIDNILSQVLWTNDFMRAQGWQTNETVVYQDNTSAIQLENNGKMSSSNRTKYINVRYFFVKDCVEQKKLRIEFLGTDELWANFYTKPLQGKKFYSFRKIILNLQN